MFAMWNLTAENTFSPEVSDEKLKKRNAFIMHVSHNIHCIHSLVAIVVTSDEKNLKIAVSKGQYVMLLFKRYLSKL